MASFDQASLVAAAGVDPWTLANNLHAGDPAQIASLAAAFYRAGGDMSDAQTSNTSAGNYVREGYTVAGSSPIDMDAQAAATKSSVAFASVTLPQIGKTLDGVATHLDTATHSAATAVSQLDGELMAIQREYLVFWQGIGHHLPPEDSQPVTQGYVDRAVSAVKSYGGTVNGIVTGYEGTLASALRTMSDLGYVPPLALDDGPEQQPASIPGAGSAPTTVAVWWNSLTPAQQKWMYDHQPGVMGNLDGVPIAARDQANRKNLPTLVTGVQSQLTALQGKEPPYTTGTPRFPIVNPAWAQWHDQVQALQQKLSGLQAVGTTLQGDHQPPLYLIGVQDTGNGRAIISTGNPDLAQNVATYVPGVGTNLTGISGGVGRSNTMYTAAVTNGASPSTAVVTWFGYDAPQGLTDGASNSYAENAAPSLDLFQSGLRATHQGTPSVNTVIGHSYGTTVVGQSASHGNTLDANNVVFVASPGVTVDHASDLSLTGVPSDQNGQHVYASTAQYDPINLAAGINGPSPTGPDFGARTFSSSPDRGHWYELGWNMGAHSSYWDSGNPSLRNMGLVIAGQGGTVS